MPKSEIVSAETAQAELLVNNKFIDGLTKQIEQKEKYGMAIAKGYSVSSELTSSYLQMKESGILDKCSQESIANSLLDMVTLGLSTRKNQGYFIAYGNKCHFQRSYFGHIAIARRYGLKNIVAEIIYKGDEFSYHIENGKKILDYHKQDFRNIDPKNIEGAYAVAEMVDGSYIMEVMNFPQIKQAWMRGNGYREGQSVHFKFPDQMAKKTVINRLCKMIANTSDDGVLNEVMDRLDVEDDSDVVAETAAKEINENANTIDFDAAVQEAAEETQAEEVDVMEQIVEEPPKEPPKEPQANKVNRPIPDFMIQE